MKRVEEEVKRKKEAAAKKAQRVAVKEVKEKAAAAAKIATKFSAAKTAAKSKKRSLVGEESGAPRKRPCAKPLRRRNQQEISNSTTKSDSQDINPKNKAASSIISARPVVRTRNAGWKPVSRPLLSGRNIKLPARFQ